MSLVYHEPVEWKGLGLNCLITTTYLIVVRLMFDCSSIDNLRTNEYESNID